jgi:PD-(D/E)XK nuclease superfamily protein
MPNQNRCNPTSTTKLPAFKTSKLRGEWVELRFMTRAAELGIMVSKPWGDSAPYDFVLGQHMKACQMKANPGKAHRIKARSGRFLRVQVKSTSHQRGRSFKCHISANQGPYLPGELDFIAAYVIPADTWYILPAHAALGQIHVMLSPHLANAKYSPYREAWHLLL